MDPADIDPELLRDLDRHLRGPQGDAPPLVPDAYASSTPRANISGVLEAIEFAASSMNATAEQVEQLEAHSQSVEAANQELEVRIQELSLQLGEAIQERDASAASLEAEKERSQRLESLAAHHISRANALERELAASQADISKVLELVKTRFGTPTDAPAAFPEEPTPG